MAKTLLNLAGEMEELAIVFRLRSRELMKFVALRVLEYLVKVTPVDTSLAISNWVVAPGGSGYGGSPIPAHYPGKGGSTAAASARRTLELAKMALKGAQPRKALAIINAAPHIKRLNEGWSDQHPGGFIEGSLLVGKRAVREYNFNRRMAMGRPKPGEL